MDKFRRDHKMALVQLEDVETAINGDFRNLLRVRNVKKNMRKILIKERYNDFSHTQSLKSLSKNILAQKSDYSF